MDPIANEIVDWLRQRMTMAGARGFVVGLSGGLDSAVVAQTLSTCRAGQVAGGDPALRE